MFVFSRLRQPPQTSILVVITKTKSNGNSFNQEKIFDPFNRLFIFFTQKSINCRAASPLQTHKVGTFNRNSFRKVVTYEFSSLSAATKEGTRISSRLVGRRGVDLHKICQLPCSPGFSERSVFHGTYTILT